GCVMKFKLAGDPTGFLRRKDTIQGHRSEGIEVVYDQPDSLRIRKLVFCVTESLRNDRTVTVVA
ncbi:MAG: hypothetical protein KDJ28_19300, partial [Candidatus Competibacteraceae bacterium]|nr:hypothetical protein [Candidatus Competibacteraceae bacterium]